jgi:CRISPR/Cas system-associated protein Csm6
MVSFSSPSLRNAPILSSAELTLQESFQAKRGKKFRIFSIFMISCNIAGCNLSIDVISEKDKRDLKLIAELDPEYVAASFVGNSILEL